VLPGGAAGGHCRLTGLGLAGLLAALALLLALAAQLLQPLLAGLEAALGGAELGVVGRPLGDLGRRLAVAVRLLGGPLGARPAGILGPPAVLGARGLVGLGLGLGAGDLLGGGLGDVVLVVVLAGGRDQGEGGDQRHDQAQHPRPSSPPGSRSPHAVPRRQRLSGMGGAELCALHATSP